MQHKRQSRIVWGNVWGRGGGTNVTSHVQPWKTFLQVGHVKVACHQRHCHASSLQMWTSAASATGAASTAVWTPRAATNVCVHLDRNCTGTRRTALVSKRKLMEKKTCRKDMFRRQSDCRDEERVIFRTKIMRTSPVALVWPFLPFKTKIGTIRASLGSIEKMLVLWYL